MTRIIIEKLAKERDHDLTGVEIVERELPVPHLAPYVEADPFVSLCAMYPERKRNAYVRRKKNEVVHIHFARICRQDNCRRSGGKGNLKNVKVGRRKTYPRRMDCSGR